MEIFNVFWSGPEFEDDELVSPAEVTMLHNGVAVHNSRELLGPVQFSSVYSLEIKTTFVHRTEY